MVTYIGKTPLTSIQNISLGSNVEISEHDLIDSEKNILLEGSHSTITIEIEETIVESLYPRGGGFGRYSGEKSSLIEGQRLDIKELVENEWHKNKFVYGGGILTGYISVENVSVPESSSEKNTRSFSISGLFLPWPKHGTEDFNGFSDEGFGTSFGKKFGGRNNI